MADSYVQLAADQTGKKIQQCENVISGNTVEAMVVVAQNPSGYVASYVEVSEGSGKKVQYFKNTIAGTEVYAQALVLVDTTGTPI